LSVPLFVQSFYACAFTYRGHKLQEVLFGGHEVMTHGYCAVDQRWRGDDFEPAIRVLIDKLGDEVAGRD
jgi:hypothetical protein